MKKYILKIAFVALLGASSSLFANEFVCSSDANYMSQSFKKNWEYLPERGYYFSYAEFDLDGQRFSGALHTQTSTLPQDNDPHLSFARVKVSKVRERYVWQVDCQYNIGNSAMADLDDRSLHVSTTVTYDKKCKKVSETTVDCD